MCPLCLATVAWIAVGATSTGGISALAIKKIGDANKERTISTKNSEQGEGGSYGQ